MRAKLGTLNHCEVPFLSRAGANLCWYYYTTICHFADCVMENKTSSLENASLILFLGFYYRA